VFVSFSLLYALEDKQYLHHAVQQVEVFFGQELWTKEAASSDCKIASASGREKPPEYY
jgi:hypothetical protein